MITEHLELNMWMLRVLNRSLCLCPTQILNSVSDDTRNLHTRDWSAK